MSFGYIFVPFIEPFILKWYNFFNLQVREKTYGCEELNNEEKIFKYLYENQINYNNYQKHEAILQSFFPDKLSYESFVRLNLQEYNFLSYKAFLPETEHMDAFFHPRFIQQSSLPMIFLR